MAGTLIENTLINVGKFTVGMAVLGATGMTLGASCVCGVYVATKALEKHNAPKIEATTATADETKTPTTWATGPEERPVLRNATYTKYRPSEEEYEANTDQRKEWQ